MLGEDLQELGFIEWLPFTLVEQSRLIGELPQSDGVYVIRSSRSFGRYRGESDIVYVGSSANATGGLKGRVKFFFRPGPSQYTSLRIKALLDRAEELEISFRICPAMEARSLEKEILKQYVDEHWELPPYNRSQPR
jgi:hypothetical protein